MTVRGRDFRGHAAETPRRPVIRATIDLAGGSVRYDPWAVDDYTGDRWVLEARERRLVEGRSVRWSLEKRGSDLIGCTRYVATRTELTAIFGCEAAARFFAPGQTENEVTLEMPVPIQMSLAAAATSPTPRSYSREDSLPQASTALTR